MRPRFLLYAVLLASLGACGTPPAERHPAGGVPPPGLVVSPPSLPPAPAASPPVASALPAPSAAPPEAADVFFTAAIDRRIEAAAGPECQMDPEEALAEHQPRPESDEPRPTAWSPWLTDYCALRAYLGETDTARYARPVPLPNRAGRRLFLARPPYCPLLLLEFDTACYRLVVLGRQRPADFGGEVGHRLYRRAGQELLAVQSVEGSMGAGRCSGGSADTWLQVWNLNQAVCLLSTPVGWYHTVIGCNDDDGTEHVGGDLTVTRRWQLRDHGRTLWLGGYQVEGKARYDAPGPDHYRTTRLSRPLQEALTLSLTPATWPLPAGTYRLRAGSYRRAR